MDAKFRESITCNHHAQRSSGDFFIVRHPTGVQVRRFLAALFFHSPVFFFCSPFQPGPNQVRPHTPRVCNAHPPSCLQYVSRTILSSVSGISGICTNGGALATASWLLLLLVPLVLS